jgi:hypothetical protein
MDKIKLFLFASLMLVSGFERATFAQCASTLLNEDFGSRLSTSCGTVADPSTSPNSYIYNQTYIQYNPGGASNSPSDGEYGIRCDASENNAGWYGGGGTTMPDHTADAAGQTGNYLLVNPGAGPREFYHRTVNNLCANTTYNLTYYAGNITRESGTPGVCNYTLLPSLQAYTFPAGTTPDNSCIGSASSSGCVPAGGTLLGSTGNMGCPSQTIFTWNMYSYNFTTGASQTSIDIVLVSLNGNNAGGDFALDDITVTSSVTGINSYSQASGLSIFPNPNNGDFTISLNKEEIFSLVNNLGQTIQTIQLNQSNNNSANVSGVEPGFYFLVGKSNALLNYKVVVGK